VFSVSGIGEARAREAKEQKAIKDENSILVLIFEVIVIVIVIVIDRMDNLRARLNYLLALNDPTKRDGTYVSCRNLGIVA
jgi:hypothetical protein